MNKPDCIGKVFFIFCATFLAMLFAFFKFGGLAEMKKNSWCCTVVCVVGFLFIVFVAIALFCCCCCCGKNYGDSGKITKYLLEKPTDGGSGGGAAVLTITKVENSDFMKDLEQAQEVKISEDFIDLPKEVLKEIKGKNIEIIYN